MTAKKQVSPARKRAMTKPRKPKTHTSNDLWSGKVVAQKLDLSPFGLRKILALVPVAGKDPTDQRTSVYDSKLILAAASKIAEKSSSASGEDKEELEKEKLRQQIRKLTVDADEAEGQVIKRDEVFQGFYNFGSQVRKHLAEQIEKLPPLLAGLTPPAMQVKLRDYNEDILEKLRRHKYSELDS